ncbi:hypothetical protein IJ095_02670, partial [Candidatus Saccharibacteria bacterium]|nr:hypothetical protein [Candidatus Saccharibacteria bacterium]
SSPVHSPATPTKFNLDQFLTTLQSTSPALYSFLHNAKFSQQGTTLNIYTANPGIVNSANNKALLAKLSGLAVNGISLSEYKSSNFGQISDIMGNVEEVTDTNGNPFS